MNEFPKDELENETFVCMYCRNEFKIYEGTFPQYFGDIMVDDADLNNRSHHEFVCYDCCD